MAEFTRRQFLANMGAGAIFLSMGSKQTFAQNSKMLSPLPMIDASAGSEASVALNLQQGFHDFGNGHKAATYGINGNYLGPVVRVKKSQSIQFDVTNNVDETAAIHWHGMHIPGNVDGGPHQAIAVGKAWNPVLEIKNRASMNWYHAHTHGRTGYQVYTGLAGVLLVEDDDSIAADLPKTHGVDDFVVVLQDKLVGSDGSVIYSPKNVNNAIAVNGILAPTLQNVAPGLVRLRILNGSNGAFIKLSLADNAPLHVIASDGGFLSATVSRDYIIMSPGERYEVLVDTSKGDVSLQTLRFDDEEITAQPGRVDTTLTAAPEIALTLTADSELKGFTGSLPGTLASVAAADPSQAVRIREFVLSEDVAPRFAAMAHRLGNHCADHDHAAMGINGRPMDMAFINETVPINEYEIWRVRSEDGAHPFHVHGCSYRILKQMGQTPPDYASGWKDMMYAAPGSVSELLVRFDHQADAKTPYMYHCHILKHEDCGMMGQFTVGKEPAYSAPLAI
ncbi:hypothetical protein RA27_22610 [Ruegeria sp. ANG-R]|uniref:multicopper oxidase domain-containing protein n=1 Tax=Ruegeria sp. ANG-R TaxID=1577903 RepID=UPI00057D7A51|nr:multicopper oxidase domain-containing protein [Ruegeria sp. ANG-R]KIC35697.1 hypothetical protein RA27_22610 [Ruegeria sp. ANG-R]